MQEFELQNVFQAGAEVISNWGLNVVGALVVLVLGLFVAKMARRWTTSALKRTQLDKTLMPFVSHLVYYALLAFVMIAVLSLFGIPTTSFIAVLGAAGLAVGLALQGTLSNFAAGVMLLFFRPFKAGDFVEAGGEQGTVREVGVFATALRTLDLVNIVLPNASIWGTTIKNFTNSPVRRNDMSIGVSYGDDISKAKQEIQQVLREDDRVLQEPAPLVVVEQLGESSVDLLVGPYCHPDDYWGLRFDMFQKIKERLEAAGLTIPFPQRDVHLFQEKA